MTFSDPDIPEQKSGAINNITFAVSGSCFLISLFNTAFCTTDHCRLSIEAFLSGWLVLFIEPAGLTWLANPLLIVALVMILKDKKSSFWLSLMASLLSLSFLLCNTIIENEAGGAREIIKLKPGYWLWVASCISCFAGALILRYRSSAE